MLRHVYLCPHPSGLLCRLTRRTTTRQSRDSQTLKWFATVGDSVVRNRGAQLKTMGLMQRQLTDFTRVIVPMACTGDHWALAEINFANCSICWFDADKSRDAYEEDKRSAMTYLERYIRDECDSRKLNTKFAKKIWVRDDAAKKFGIPQQDEPASALYMLQYAHKLASGNACSFTETTEAVRVAWVISLVKGSVA